MRYKNLNEDSAFAIPTNQAGGGAIDGIGVGPKGEPGIKLKKKKLRALFPVLKRTDKKIGNV